MSRRSFNPSECIASLNNIKLGMQFREKPMTTESLKNVLQSCGLPINSIFRKVLQQFDIIKKINRNQYIFIGKDPIYLGRLQEAQKEYLKLLKKRKNPVSISEILPKQVSEIEAAIALLKKNGYLIFKQV